MAIFGDGVVNIPYGIRLFARVFYTNIYNVICLLNVRFCLKVGFIVSFIALAVSAALNVQLFETHIKNFLFDFYNRKRNVIIH